MKPSLSRQLAEQAQQRKQAGLQRRRIPVTPDTDHHGLVRDGHALIDFSSNDYLGLGGDIEIRQAMAEAALHLGPGAGASPLVTGYHGIHRELEAALADFTGFAGVVLFPSGYQANLAIGQALLGRGRAVLADRLNHASLNDGMRLAGARIIRYRHADGADAKRRLTDSTAMIASDGVFSMDGDLAPLCELTRLGRERDIPVWIDDAHGFGVLGQHGRGVLEHLDITPTEVDIFVATFGKALGTAGAFVAGDRALIEHLENVARPLIFSTAPSPALCAATLKALHKLAAEDWRRQRLAEHIDRFRQRCHKAGIPLFDSFTPIQIVPVAHNQRAVELGSALAHAGFAVAVIRPPTVPAGSARLRVTLSSAHQPQDIDRLVRQLADLIHLTDDSFIDALC